MKKYMVEISESAKQDLENIVLYLRYNLAGDIIADKYKILFKQQLKNLENVAKSMLIIVDEENFKVFVLRIGHAFMDWEKYLKDA